MSSAKVKQLNVNAAKLGMYQQMAFEQFPNTSNTIRQILTETTVTLLRSQATIIYLEEEIERLHAQNRRCCRN